MKRCFSLLLVLILFIFAAVPCFAAEGSVQTEGLVEYFPDGSYIITQIENVPTENACKGTVTKTKSSNYYDDNNVLQWTVKLTASFSYNGTAASCTGAVTSQIIYVDAWRVTKSVPSYSGNVATGEFTVKKYLFGIPIKTVNKTLTLTCSPSGVVT